MRYATERRRAKQALSKAEQALDESHARTRAIVNTAVDAIITIDQHGIIESANPATQRLFGYSEAELLGRNIKRLMPEPYRGEHDGYLLRYLRTGEARIIGSGREVTGMRKDGSVFPMSLAVSEMPLGARRLFTGIVHDLTDLRRLEREILEATAREQQRIGQDLHDSLCQDLISIAFGMELTARRVEGKSAVEAEQIRKLGESVASAADQARKLAHGLNPIQFDTGGFPAALEELTARISDSFKVRCTFYWDQLARVQDYTIALHLYRIAQEAVSNAIKHGKASRIDVRLTLKKAQLSLSVRDNGKGMPHGLTVTQSQSTSVSGPSTSQTGMGLRTMQYRARLVGGNFEIMRGPRGGTVVSCAIRDSDRRDKR